MRFIDRSTIVEARGIVDCLRLGAPNTHTSTLRHRTLGCCQKHATITCSPNSSLRCFPSHPSHQSRFCFIKSVMTHWLYNGWVLGCSPVALAARQKRYRLRGSEAPRCASQVSWCVMLLCLGVNTWWVCMRVPPISISISIFFRSLRFFPSFIVLLLWWLPRVDRQMSVNETCREKETKNNTNNERHTNNKNKEHKTSQKRTSRERENSFFPRLFLFRVWESESAPNAHSQRKRKHNKICQA